MPDSNKSCRAQRSRRWAPLPVEAVERRLLFAVDITTKGASTGSADNTAAINSAITAAAASTDKRVFVPSGVFKHAGVINLSGGVELYGNGDFGGAGTPSELGATNPNNISIKITGSNSAVRKLKVSGTTAGGRLTNDASALILADNASFFAVERVDVGTGASAGLLITHGSDNGIVNSNKVHDTLADGIHMVHGADHMSVTNNQVTSVGDDMIAVVSYVTDAEGWSGTVTIRGNTLTNTGRTNGRGITVDGGHDVTIDNNIITDAPMAGIYISSSDAYDNFNVSNVTVTRNTVNHANTTNTGGHGGIFVSGRSGHVVANVTIGNATDATQKNAVNNSVGQGVAIGDFTSNVKVLRNAIDQATDIGIKVSDAGAVQLNNNVIKRTAHYGIFFQGACTGASTISGNVFENINTSNDSVSDVIKVSSGASFSSLAITNNSFTQPGGYAIDWYIDSSWAGTVVSGNTTNTGEPINPPQ